MTAPNASPMRAVRTSTLLSCGIAITLLAATMASPAAAADTIVHIVYLTLDTHRPAASAVLDPPLTDEGVQGARLAAADNATTGKFLGQSYALDEIKSATEADLQASFTKSLAAGQRLFVTDVPAKLLLAMADQNGAASTLLLDATTRDDSLRGADCRANVLHLLPDRAMLADALMQYLVTKDWKRVLLLSGTSPADTRYADAIRQSAKKFEIKLRDDRVWRFNPAAQQADTGHYQVNDEVAKATQGVTYDVLVVADEEDNFGDELSYRTETPRPIAGTQGLVAEAWSPIMDEYASTQLQLRFRRQAGRPMTERDYGGWLAVRAIGEAATRGNTTDPAALIAFLHSASFTISGYKGPPLSFRAWDGQLRQPVLLADTRSLISISPQPGFLHQTNDLDSLGTDQPETACHKH
jgi:ABC transporter substrate binding protein (PQQ-dependent alcohol dehydrogenase system)